MRPHGPLAAAFAVAAIAVMPAPPATAATCLEWDVPERAEIGEVITVRVRVDPPPTAPLAVTADTPTRDIAVAMQPGAGGFYEGGVTADTSGTWTLFVPRLEESECAKPRQVEVGTRGTTNAVTGSSRAADSGTPVWFLAGIGLIVVLGGLAAALLMRRADRQG